MTKQLIRKHRLSNVRMTLEPLEKPQLIKLAEKKKGRPPKLYKLDDFEPTGSVLSNINELHERKD